MTHLKLKKILDRTPVKINLSLSPETHEELLLYSEFYRDAHGTEETPQTLASQIEAARYFV